MKEAISCKLRHSSWTPLGGLPTKRLCDSSSKIGSLQRSQVATIIRRVKNSNRLFQQDRKVYNITGRPLELDQIWLRPP
jgi:hypothetical protein